LRKLVDRRTCSSVRVANMIRSDTSAESSFLLCTAAAPKNLLSWPSRPTLRSISDRSCLYRKVHTELYEMPESQVAEQIPQDSFYKLYFVKKTSQANAKKQIKLQ